MKTDLTWSSRWYQLRSLKIVIKVLVWWCPLIKLGRGRFVTNPSIIMEHHIQQILITSNAVKNKRWKFQGFEISFLTLNDITFILVKWRLHFQGLLEIWKLINIHLLLLGEAISLYYINGDLRGIVANKQVKSLIKWKSFCNSLQEKRVIYFYHTWCVFEEYCKLSYWVRLR